MVSIYFSNGAEAARSILPCDIGLFRKNIYQALCLLLVKTAIRITIGQDLAVVPFTSRKLVTVTEIIKKLYDIYLHRDVRRSYVYATLYFILLKENQTR